MGLCSNASHTLNTYRPPGLSTRRASCIAFTLSGKNISPYWHASTSNDPSPNGNAHASAADSVSRGSVPSVGRATAIIASFKSVATSDAPVGMRRRISCVTIPVPHASSSTRSPGLTASRRAMSLA